VPAGVRATVALLALPLAVACSTGDGGSFPAQPAPVETTTTTTSPPLDDAAGSEPEPEPTGAVVAVDYGFSLFPDPVDPDDQLGAFGVVVENTDEDLLATGVLVTVRLLDDAGAEVVSDTSLLNGLQPGARLAVGRMLVEPVERIASLDVVIEVAAWLVPADREGAVVAAEVTTEPNDGGGLTTAFEVWSTRPDDEEGVDVAAVYRDADGRLLGVEMGTIDLVPAGGSAEGAIRLLAPIPDLAVTDVLVGRGFAAHTSG
jgi:hypothetical protein